MEPVQVQDRREACGTLFRYSFNRRRVEARSESQRQGFPFSRRVRLLTHALSSIEQEREIAPRR
jgi:hypothetical protein